jgi:DNA-binding MarR family transcriptional regulator
MIKKKMNEIVFVKRRRTGVFMVALAILLLVPVGVKAEGKQKLEKALDSICFRGIDNTKATERKLGILFALSVRGNLTFNELGELTGYSPGSISQDTTRLEKNGLLTRERKFLPNGMRQTTYDLTKKGKQDLRVYLDSIASCRDLLSTAETCG